MTAVKNRRAASEYLDAPLLAGELAEIVCLNGTEVKEKKKQNKGLDDMADESEAEQDEEEEDEEDATTSLQHMMVGDAPTLPFKDPKAAKLEDGKKLSDKLMAFKKIAQRRVPRSFWVKFIIFGVAVH